MSVFSIESVAKWAGKLLLEEVKFLSEVGSKVEELQTELERILVDIDQKEDEDARIRKWVSEVRDLALEAEDVIETYMLKVPYKRQKEWVDLKWLSCFFWDAVTLQSVGSSVDELTRKIKSVSSSLHTYGVEASHHSSSSDHFSKKIAEERRTYAHLKEKELVGLEVRIDHLVKEVVNGPRRVVVTHGMGGIGKTTLAREVYHHKSVVDHFDGCAWAYISQHLQLGTICSEILAQLSTVESGKLPDYGKLPDSQLPGKIYDILKHKRCLVVLDDIWSADDWKRLQPLFPIDDHGSGSKVLITTRDPRILSHLRDDVVRFHEVNSLDLVESWDLIQKKADFQRNSAETAMVELGAKMVDHCSGHPLAISVLGRSLLTKRSLEEWREICNNICSSLQVEEGYTWVHQVLAMSYYDLAYDLKACFLVLAYFPRDCQIRAERLYSVWIGEGIVSATSTSTSLEDTAEGCLNDLVGKGMIQVLTKDLHGKILTCRLHDLMLDMCLEMAKEEKFLQIVDGQQQASEGRLRRVAIKGGCHAYQSFMSSSPDWPPLRSLLFFPVEGEKICPWTPFKSGWDLLRVLDFEGLEFDGPLPIEIGRLVFLRFLSIKDTDVEELPSSINKLTRLVVLDLRVRSGGIKLPNVLCKLESLRQLYLPRSDSIPVEYEIGKGEMLRLKDLGNLEKLVNVDLDRVSVDGLSKLRRLRKLSAVCASKTDTLLPFLKSTTLSHLSVDIDARLLYGNPSMLQNCHFLKTLIIRSEKDCRYIHAKMFPQNLMELSIMYCDFQEDPFPVLEKLPMLKSLTLMSCNSGERWVCSSDSFPELRYLCIHGWRGLEEWLVEEGGLPKLDTLELYELRNLKMLPDVLRPQISVTCRPCVVGVERHRSCPDFKRQLRGRIERPSLP